MAQTINIHIGEAHSQKKARAQVLDATGPEPAGVDMSRADISIAPSPVDLGRSYAGEFNTAPSPEGVDEAEAFAVNANAPAPSLVEDQGSSHYANEPEPDMQADMAMAGGETPEPEDTQTAVNAPSAKTSKTRRTKKT